MIRRLFCVTDFFQNFYGIIIDKYRFNHSFKHYRLYFVSIMIHVFNNSKIIPSYFFKGQMKKVLKFLNSLRSICNYNFKYLNVVVQNNSKHYYNVSSLFIYLCFYF